MTPDALIVFSGGSVAEKNPKTGETSYRSTTYAESDAFGTLGGYARVQAAALLARTYPQAFLVTTGKEGPDDKSHANIQAAELVALGVPRERIVLEESSVNTKSQIEESLRIVREREWRRVLFISNEYQIGRIRAFVEHLPERPVCDILYQSAEDVLAKDDPAFAAEFARIKESEPYHRRLAAEARGVAAIKSGSYRPASTEDKRERPV
ncbi:MAG: YdcF family protein [Patescibacteria group bacterium]|nr:YdcF family protein [Patescibacteria group bacterium]